MGGGEFPGSLVMLQVGFVKVFFQDVPKNGGLKFRLNISENIVHFCGMD